MPLLCQLAICLADLRLGCCPGGREGERERGREGGRERGREGEREERKEGGFTDHIYTAYCRCLCIEAYLDTPNIL